MITISVSTCAFLPPTGRRSSGIGTGERGAAAGLAGIVVGGLTQDTFGDLEVARSAWTWLAIGVVASRTEAA